MDPTPRPKSKRGFASMDPERRREIARQGGKAVPRHRRSFFTDREHAAEAGRKGGEKGRYMPARNADQD